MFMVISTQIYMISNNKALYHAKLTTEIPQNQSQDTQQTRKHHNHPPIKSISRICLEEVNNEQELIGTRIDQVFQHGAKEHFKGVFGILSYGHVD